MSEVSNTIYYKVSYVVLDDAHPGAIISEDKRPAVGDEVTFDNRVFEIVEVAELMPPTGNFGFLHATCRYLRDAD
jgi:hypothetical protein